MTSVIQLSSLSLAYFTCKTTNHIMLLFCKEACLLTILADYSLYTRIFLVKIKYLLRDFHIFVIRSQKSTRMPFFYGNLSI